MSCPARPRSLGLAMFGFGGSRGPGAGGGRPGFGAVTADDQTCRHPFTGSGAPGCSSSASSSAPTAASSSVQIADPLVVASVLRFRVPADVHRNFRDIQLSIVTGGAAAVGSAVVGTRPPSHVACRVDDATAEWLPFQLGLSGHEDGVFAPVYRLAQQCYDACFAAVGVPCRGGVHRSFTCRGCPPGLVDNTMLWPLESLDAPDGAPPFVRVAEEGVHDMLAWFAWHAMAGMLQAQRDSGRRSWRQDVLALGAYAGEIVALLNELRALLERSVARTPLDDHARDVQLLLIRAGHHLADCDTRARARLVTLAMHTRGPEMVVDEVVGQLGQCRAYGGVIHLFRLGACARTDAAVAASYTGKLLETVLHVHDSAAFLFGPSDRDVSTLPTRYRCSPAVSRTSVAKLAFAVLIAAALCREHGLGAQAGVAIASRICSSRNAWTASDEAALARCCAVAHKLNDANARYRLLALASVAAGECAPQLPV